MDPATEPYPPGAQVHYRPTKYDLLHGTVYSILPPTQPTLYLKKNLPNNSNFKMVIWSISFRNGLTLWPSHLLHPHNHQQTTLLSPSGFDMEKISHKNSTMFDISVISTRSKHDSIKYHSSIITLTIMSSGGGNLPDFEKNWIIMVQ